MCLFHFKSLEIVTPIKVLHIVHHKFNFHQVLTMFLLLYNFVISFNNFVRGIGAFICIPILKIKGGGWSRFRGIFFRNFELLTFPCREMIKLSIHI